MTPVYHRIYRESIHRICAAACGMRTCRGRWMPTARTRPSGRRQAADGAQSAAGTQGVAAYSFASQTVPTWEKLGQKPDIEIVDIRNNGRKLPYAAERHDILNSEEVRSLYSQPPVNRDTGELIFVTPATLSHSFSNSGEDSIYAVRHLRKILENAVLTHAEPSRKANDNSPGVYTLFGAVRTETGIQPVKLKVKEYRNVGQDIPEAVRAYFERNGTQEEYSRAYDSRVLSLESIEKEEPSSSAFTSTPNGAVEYPSSSSTIRVQDLLRLVNSRYRKYVPTFSEMEKELSTGWSIDEMAGEDAANRRGYTPEQRRQLSPDLGNEATVFAEDGSGWSHSASYDPETASIKEQIENSRTILNRMEVVARASVPTNLKNKDGAAAWAAEHLRGSGYRVDRQGYGDIFFSKKDLDKGLRYADTSEEKAALAVLPQVLKRGIEIGDHANHKQRTKQTVTFAAPVELNGVRGNMGVVVNRNGNHYYAHRIVLPDGTAFRFSDTNDNAAQELSRGVADIRSLADTTSAASGTSIPTGGGNVNTDHAAARKAAQLATIERSNPFDPELGAHTWIRSVEDILTYREAIDSFGGVDDVTPAARRT